MRSTDNPDSRCQAIVADATLQPYIDDYLARCPDAGVGVEVASTLAWYRQHMKAPTVEQVVSNTIAFLKKIRLYIAAAKQEMPGMLLDIEMLDIFECIKSNMKSRPVSDGLRVAEKMRSCLDAWQLMHDKREVDSLTRNFACYVTHQHPLLPPLNAARRIELIRKKLAGFLAAGESGFNFIDKSFNIEIIKYCLWVANEYPKLEAREGLKWAKVIASSDLYSRTKQLFPPSYPFHYIGFDTYTNGKATLEIWAKTRYGSPNLQHLLVVPDSRIGGYLDKSIVVDFNFNTTDTLDTALKKCRYFLNIIETTLLARDASRQIFHDKKWKFIDAVKCFYHDFVMNFPGLKWEQLTPPVIEVKRRTDEEAQSMYDAMNQLDIITLQKLLFNGANAKGNWWGTPMLDTASSMVNNYDISMTAGELTEKCRDELFRRHELTGKFKAYSFLIIIAKQLENYRLYWCTQQRLIMDAAINNAENIAFLNSLPAHYFKNDSLKSASNSAEMIRLKEILVPHLQTTLEQKRRDRATTIVQMTALLMEYGADPGWRDDPAHPGSETLLEKIMGSASDTIRKDEVSRNLLCELIRLTLRFDRKRSHLVVADAYANDFMGQLILKFQKSFSNEGKLPQQVESVEPVSTWLGDFLRFTNSRNTEIYLKTVSLTEFTDHEKIIALCKKTFPWQGKRSEEEFTASIKRKLRPSKEIGVIDLVYDQQGGIVAFNIAVVVLPHKQGLPVLHYVRLTSSDPTLQSDFREIIMQISCQRILFLKKYFNQEILTFMAAASAVTYSRVASLPEVYPKHNCLRPQDLQYFVDTFFDGKVDLINSGRYYYPSNLFYHAVRPNEFADEATLYFRGYNDLIEIPGFCPILAFAATERNLEKLAQKFLAYETFSSVAEKAGKMNVDACNLVPRL